MNFSSYLIQNGVSTQTVFLLLALPFLAFIISLCRQLIGVQTFSIYQPMVLAYALFLISNNFFIGLAIGVPLVLIAWLVDELVRRALSGLRIHSPVRIALKLSVTSIVVLGFLSLAAYFGIAVVVNVNVFALVIMITLIESISLFEVKIGQFKTLIMSISTLVISVLAYMFLTIDFVQKALVQLPYLVFLPLVGIVLVGRYQGLVVSEFARFWSIFKND